MPVARLRGRQSLRRIFRFGFCEGLLYFFGGGTGLARDADGHVCGKFLGKIHEFARATLPHLRKDPADGVAHILALLLGLRPPLLGKIHMHNASVVGIDLTLDQTLFFQRSQQRGNPARRDLKRGSQLRGRLRALSLKL